MPKLAKIVFAAVLLPTAALAQAVPPAPPEATTGEPISALMFMTIGGVLLVALVAFASFLTKRSNRRAANRVLNPNHPSNQ